MGARAVRIAIDVDGGDHGAAVTLPAAALFLAKRLDAHVVLVGLESSLALVSKAIPAPVSGRVSRVIATEVVGMNESPALTLKSKKNSSLRLALNTVRDGQADACVSAGNTGALMANARFVLKTLPGIDRPAIASLLPTHKGHGKEGDGGVLMLDLGANVDCTAEHLRQFAIMGAALCSALTDKERPTVALLNIGEEEIKGNDIVKEAAELIRATDLNFIGNVEGTDVFRGTVDVVVCDGFVGNVALKASEGIATLMAQMLREEFSRNVFAKLSAALAYPVLRRFKARMDPSQHNGATLLGLRGIVVKSHGDADVVGFATAIERAYEEARHDLIAELTLRVAALNINSAIGPAPATDVAAVAIGNS